MKEYIIKETGSIVRREITETEVSPSMELFTSLAKDSWHQMPRVMKHPELGNLNVAIAKNQALWTMRLKELEMMAPFRPTGDNVLVPVFNSKDDTVLKLIWTPPEGMSLLLCVHITQKVNTSGQLTGHTLNNGVYLFARNENVAGPNFHLLPLPNLYEDGKVCTGRSEDWRRRDQIDVLTDSLETFKASQWNNDLWRSAEKSQMMFRFQVAEKETKVLPPDGNWVKLCQPLVTAITSNVIL